MKGERTLEKQQVLTLNSNTTTNVGGYKIIEINLPDTENLFAVCTPVKKQ